MTAKQNKEPTPLRKREKEKGGWGWGGVIFAVLLHVVAIGTGIAYFMNLGPFAPSTTSEQKSDKKNEKPAEKSRKKY